MRVSSTALRVLTSLRVGERVLVRSDDGLLAAEYALFDVTDIVLRASDPVSVREAGYMTTAHEALGRLARVGITPGLASEAARALAPEVAASYARGATARNIVPRLTAYELFEGGVFSAAAQHYEGAWLDLTSFARAVALPAASTLLQALHLAAAMSEVPGSTPVHLSTAAATRDRRPGERTHVRLPLDGARALPEALHRLGPQSAPIELDPTIERRTRQALLVRLRERASTDISPRLRTHLNALEAALAMRTMQLGPLADDDLRAIERKLAGGDAQGVEGELDALEESRGRLPGIRYLRARAALLRGEEAPRSVAQVLSELAEEDSGFHEAELGAARTWLAAGDDANARMFAQRLANNPTAPESERLIALEILDETDGGPRFDEAQGPAVNTPSPLPRARVPLFPSLGEMPSPQPVPQMPSLMPPALPPARGWSRRPQAEGQVWEPTLEEPTGPGRRPPEPSQAPRGGWGPTNGIPNASWVPAPDPAPAGPVRTRMSPRYEPELVESLALPFGASESVLTVNELPRTPLQARIAMTRLSRDLARDYRLWYGKTLRCNVLAVDAMQQHLSHRYAGASIADEKVAWELRRHGSLLSEILARALGGVWVDIGPTEPGYWAMAIPPSTRLWPIGRVYRFVALGNRERDLVSYYVDIEARVRKAQI
jgi:hypothetical protein